MSLLVRADQNPKIWFLVSIQDTGIQNSGQCLSERGTICFACSCLNIDEQLMEEYELYGIRISRLCEHPYSSAGMA